MSNRSRSNSSSVAGGNSNLNSNLTLTSTTMAIPATASTPTSSSTSLVHLSVGNNSSSSLSSLQKQQVSPIYSKNVDEKLKLLESNHETDEDANSAEMNNTTTTNNNINSLNINFNVNNTAIGVNKNNTTTNNNNRKSNLTTSSSVSSASSTSSSSASSNLSKSSFVSANVNLYGNNSSSNNSASANNNNCNNSIVNSSSSLVHQSISQLQLQQTNESTQLNEQNSHLDDKPSQTVDVTNKQIESSPDALKKTISQKESTYKKQKENYLTEKKRITNDILTIMRDERIIILADWLKVRGSLKNWIKLYVILKPGIMLLFKSDKMKSGQWVGTVILNSCQLLERPSKKHGFCFKLFHPLERSIWASKGPAGETYINVPYILLPTFYLIFRAPSEKVGNIWMEAIELALKSSHLAKPNAQQSQQITTTNHTNPMNSQQLNESFKSNSQTSTIKSSLEKKNSMYLSHQQIGRVNSKTLIKFNSKDEAIMLMSQENEIENKHFKDIINDESAITDSENGKNSSDEICSLNGSTIPDENLDEDEYFSNSNENDLSINDESSRQANCDEFFSINKINRNSSTYDQLNKSYHSSNETKYIPSPKEEFGEGQTEEVAEENKSLIFCLVKQVRPGMDLSKVVLPTFILEPRSFLEKLTDFYYHSDILTETINNDDPYERMKTVVKFYLSGFYKKPKGLKKPYNPILGEVFRSYWYNPKTDSKTFYIAEQVSHHPPITSFYVTNRKDGFCIYGTVLARSKFYGNSVSAIMDGKVKLILLNRGEEYEISMPYANCKGILIGKLTMELGGKVSIQCAKTGYSAEIEFKLKPLLGGIDASNLIDGKIKFAKETLAVIHGKWDSEIILQEKTGTETTRSVLWCPNQQIIDNRLKRFIVPQDEQLEFESEKLWAKVSEAIQNSDQNLATEEKTKIELKQREEELERRSKFIEYKSKLFTYDSITKEWLYNYSDLRPWDPQTDQYQYEYQFRIFTKTKHKLKVPSRMINTHGPMMRLGRSSSHISHHHHTIVSNVVESNECLVSNESYDLIVQYNDIKQRLESIEDYLKQMNKRKDTEHTFMQLAKINRNLINNHNNNTNNNSNTSNYFFNNFLFNLFSSSNSRNLKSMTFVLFLAWLVGIISAIVSFRFINSS